MSLGGSALLNWIGRAGREGAHTLVAAATVSVPLDLMASGIAIGQGLNRIYTWHFLTTLKPKALAMASAFPARSTRIASRACARCGTSTTSSPRRCTGSRGADDYWTRASSKPWLRDIEVPTLVLNARNDPFVPAPSLPGPHEVAAVVRLEQPATGGHVGFMTGPAPGVSTGCRNACSRGSRTGVKRANARGPRRNREKLAASARYDRAP